MDCYPSSPERTTDTNNGKLFSDAYSITAMTNVENYDRVITRLKN
jgi:hypothetical protein